MPGERPKWNNIFVIELSKKVPGPHAAGMENDGGQSPLSCDLWMPFETFGAVPRLGGLCPASPRQRGPTFAVLGEAAPEPGLLPRCSGLGPSPLGESRGSDPSLSSAGSLGCKPARAPAPPRCLTCARTAGTCPLQTLQGSVGGSANALQRAQRECSSGILKFFRFVGKSGWGDFRFTLTNIRFFSLCALSIE